MLGREVQTLVAAYQTPGAYDVTFEAGNLVSGMYFYRLETRSFALTGRMSLAK
jgi:hypothetical protein